MRGSDIHAVIVLYALWCGACWVLRGGAWGALMRKLGWEPGTTWTRVCCAVLMAGPLLTWWAPVTVFAAMTLGYLRESMGVVDARDVAWMSAWGFVVCAVMTVFSPCAVLGALAGPIYLGQRVLGNGRFDWTQRAEACVGVVFGLVLWYGA